MLEEYEKYLQSLSTLKDETHNYYNNLLELIGVDIPKEIILGGTSVTIIALVYILYKAQYYFIYKRWEPQIKRTRDKIFKGIYESLHKLNEVFDTKYTSLGLGIFSKIKMITNIFSLIKFKKKVPSLQDQKLKKLKIESFEKDLNGTIKDQHEVEQHLYKLLNENFIWFIQDNLKDLASKNNVGMGTRNKLYDHFETTFFTTLTDWDLALFNYRFKTKTQFKLQVKRWYLHKMNAWNLLRSNRISKEEYTNISYMRTLDAEMAVATNINNNALIGVIPDLQEYKED